MLNKPSKKNFHSLYYTFEEKSSKLGLFSAARVVLPLNMVDLIKIFDISESTKILIT